MQIRNSESSTRSAYKFCFPAVATALLLMSQTLSGAASLQWQGAAANTNWDVGLSTSWLNGGNLSTYADGDDVIFDDSALSLFPRIAATVQPDSITVNATNDFTFSGSGVIAGTTGLLKDGTGALAINNANTFTGTVTVVNGVLRYGNANALGTTPSAAVYVTNNGTVDPNSLNVQPRTFFIAGSGFNGQGALNDSTSVAQRYEVSNIVMTADATIGSSVTNGRWDQAAKGGTFIGNGFNLTKVGPGQFWISPGDGTNGDLVDLGDIDIQDGTLGIRTVGAIGDPTKTITIHSNTSLVLWGNSGMLNKNLVMDSGTLSSGLTAPESSNNFVGLITLSGTNTISAGSAALRLWDTISGTGGFIKTGANPLWLDGANTYSGPTLIQGGNVVLTADATLGTNLIDLGAGLNIDAAAKPDGLTLVGGQILVAGNNSSILGSLNLQSGSKLVVGKNSPGLVSADQVSLAGATVHVVLGTDPSDMSGSVNSLLNDNGNLALSGVTTFEIEPWGELAAGTPYIVAQYNGTFTGDLSNLQAVSLNPAYTFTFLDPATTAPYIEVVASGDTQPKLWVGSVQGAANVWDTSTMNWFNTVGQQSSVFYNGDSVIFDDTAVTNEVTLSGSTAATVTFNNNNLNYLLDGAGPFDGTLEMDGSGTVTLAMTNMPVFSTINLNAGTLVFDKPTVGGSTAVSAPINGSGTIVQAGSNTVVLGGTNLFYAGTIIVTNGVLQYSTSNSFALGATTSTLYATNGGTFDLVGGGTGSGVKDVAVSGTGYQGQGALNYSGTSTANQTLAKSIRLLGDTTVGSSGRWNASGTFNGNGFNLTKVGSGQFWLYSLSGDTGLGDITVTAGEFAVYGSGSYKILGDPTKTVTVQKGATMLVYQKPTAIKNLVLNQGTLSSGYSVAGGYNYWVGQITLNYTNTFSVGTNLWISNSIGGPGGFTKSGAYTLGLVGTACTYTGPTFISAGTLLVGTNVSLASSLISVAANTRLDVSQPLAFPLGNGQTLGGAGTVVGGNVVFGSGATLETSLSDASVATLTASGNLSFQVGSTNRVVVSKGTTLTNNKVTGAASVTFGGTLAIVKIGSTPLAAGDAIPLFSASGYSGSFDAITPATPGAGLAWDTSTLTTDGTLRVVSGGVDTTPTNITAQITNDQLSLSWPASHLGWRLQVQTNAPGAGLGTNWVDVANSATSTQVTLPMDHTAGSVFYRLVYP